MMAANLAKVCETCIFWKSMGQVAVAGGPVAMQQGTGMCKRYPPQMNMIATPQGMVTASNFPTSSKNDWCGEHQSYNTPIIGEADKFRASA